MNYFGSASTGASPQAQPHLYLTQRLSISCRPSDCYVLHSSSMFDGGIASPRASIVAGHRGENTTDELRAVARVRPHADGIERDVANAQLAQYMLVGHGLRRNAAATSRHAYATVHASFAPGFGPTVGAEHRRRRRRWKLSLRVAKKAAFCATADASLSMGCPFRA